jgi:serine/threonine-protein kinase
MNLEIGSIVGDYQIVEVLGAGGMGKVFKVRNTISERIEAMKVLLPDLAGEPDLADRFLREIKVLASLEHPNIAGLRTALRFENQLLMVMEYVEGVTLEHSLQQQGRLPVGEAVYAISQVLSALAYAHGRGVIHRDIKPANMMRAQDGAVKLMDFGIAKSAADRKLTMTGTTMGSLYYMSPEQINGAQTLDARSDLYSVGVSLYEMVTGKHPFDGDSQFAIMAAHLQATPVPPITIDPSLPPELNEIILLSVNREPGSRFQTANAFRNALSSLLPATAPVAAPAAAPPRPVQSSVSSTAATMTVPSKAAPAAARASAPPPAPVPPAAKSHRALWATVGALCCVGIIVGVIQFGPWKKAAAGGSSVPPVDTASSTPVAPTPTSPPSPSTAPVADAATAPSAQPVAPASAVPSSVSAAPGAPMNRAPNTSVASVPRPRAPQPASAAAQPVAQEVAQPQPPSQPQSQPQQPVVQPPPQPDLSAQRAELQKVRVALVTLATRANSIHGTLQNLQRSQAASGLGLRSDWVQSASLMDSFLAGSHDALTAGDAAAAKDLMEKAERQVEKLEKALNK